MKAKLLAIALLVGSVLSILTISGCKKSAAAVSPDTAFGAYGSEADWNDSTKVLNLGYQESQGKRVFYQHCVWCHANATPAGPSNRSNLTPTPPLMNDGEKLNGESDEYMENIVTLGGSALGKSAMMPPYGKTLSPADVAAVIAFTRAIAQPAYQKTGRPGSQYTGNRE
jgi:mono/diheme cytochrome c family protein